MQPNVIFTKFQLIDWGYIGIYSGTTVLDILSMLMMASRPLVWNGLNLYELCIGWELVLYSILDT